MPAEMAEKLSEEAQRQGISLRKLWINNMNRLVRGILDGDPEILDDVDRHRRRLQDEDE